MGRTASIAALLATAFLTIAAAPARADQGPSLLDWSLKSLEAPETRALDRYQGKPVLMMFFEPECSWCFRQVRAINALAERCGGGFQALAVGVNANRAGLKQELRRLRPDFPAYEASPALLQSLGGVPATPFTLLGDVTGTYLDWTRGYLPEAELEEFMRQRGVPACSDAVAVAARSAGE